jgi:hypothetical protein
MSCDDCFGTGRTLQHSPDCDDPDCALNAGYNSCAGELVPCDCPLGRRVQLSPGLRRCPWLAHPKAQQRHGAEQIPARRRRAFYRRPWPQLRLAWRLRARRAQRRYGAFQALAAAEEDRISGVVSALVAEIVRRRQDEDLADGPAD